MTNQREHSKMFMLHNFPRSATTQPSSNDGQRRMPKPAITEEFLPRSVTKNPRCQSLVSDALVRVEDAITPSCFFAKTPAINLVADTHW